MGKAIVVQVGDRFGRWTVTSADFEIYRGPGGHSSRRYACRCDCGNEAFVLLSSLNSGASNSCGCLSREGFAERIHRHGHRHERIYKIWNNMKQRSPSAHRKAYANVGRDPRWDDFVNFYADMAGSYFDGAQLGRYGDEGDYTPTNCRWITAEENQRERIESGRRKAAAQH